MLGVKKKKKSYRYITLISLMQFVFTYNATRCIWLDLPCFIVCFISSFSCSFLFVHLFYMLKKIKEGLCHMTLLHDRIVLTR